MMASIILIFLMAFNQSVSVDSGDISIHLKIDEIKDAKGELKIALYVSKKTFMTEDSYKLFSEEIDELHTKSIEIHSLLPGSYSICIFHDVNSNGILDKNFFGIPLEPYGFSNNPTLFFGPPDFNRTKFEITSGNNKELIIHLN